MRCVVLGVLAAAGCNQIWGIGEVVRNDIDAPDVDPNLPRIRLTTQIAQTNPLNGYADQTPAYGAISPRPAVQIGLPGEALMNAVYEDAASPPGQVAFPAEYLNKPWRLAYTVEGDVPREVQWAPTAHLAGHVVETLIGRPERAPVPVNSGYSITPQNLPVNFQHAATRVFTTGIWTEGRFATVPAGSKLDYAFDQKAKSISGPLGAPEQAKHDHGVLVDFANTGGCRVATGTATFEVPDLKQDSLEPPATQPTYIFADKQVQLVLPSSPTPIHIRIQSVLGSRTAAAPDAVRWEYGYAPSLEMFGFSKPVIEQLGEFLLPSPRMLALADCSYTEGNEVLMTPPYADSPELRSMFSRVVHVEVVNTRTASGVELRSGFAGVVTAAGDTFTSDFAVAAPLAFKLFRGDTQIADLSDGADGVTLPAGAEAVELKFDVESGPLDADYFDVTLYQIQTGRLDRQRVYTITEQVLTIDRSFLLPDTEYVLEVRSYRGRPDVVRTNFTVISNPQYVASIFTRTFRTPP